MEYVREQVFYNIDIIRDPSILTRIYNVLVHPVMINIYVVGGVACCLIIGGGLFYYGAQGLCKQIFPFLANDDKILSQLKEQRTDCDFLYKQNMELKELLTTGFEESSKRIGKMESTAKQLENLTGQFKGTFPRIEYVDGIKESFNTRLIDMQGIINTLATKTDAINLKCETSVVVMDTLGTKVELLEKIVLDLFLPLIQKLGTQKGCLSSKGGEVLHNILSSEAIKLTSGDMEALLELTLKLL